VVWGRERGAVAVESCVEFIEAGVNGDFRRCLENFEGVTSKSLPARSAKNARGNYSERGFAKQSF
jgi:hypothetical protein